MGLKVGFRIRGLKFEDVEFEAQLAGQQSRGQPGRGGSSQMRSA